MRKTFVAAAICEYVERYFVANSIRFEFYVDKPSSNFDDLLEETLKLCTKSDPYRIVTRENHPKYSQHHSAVLFYDSLENLADDFFTGIAMVQEESTEIKSLIYCRGCDSAELKIKFQNVMFPDKQLFLNRFNMLDYENRHNTMNVLYQTLSFLIEENGEIVIKTLTTFTAEKCGILKLIEINRFSKTALKWDTREFSTPEVVNIHGCPLNIVISQKMMPWSHCYETVPETFEFNQDLMDTHPDFDFIDFGCMNKYYQKYEFENESVNICNPPAITTRGLLPWMMTTIATSLNYTTNYIKCKQNEDYDWHAQGKMKSNY